MSKKPFASWLAKLMIMGLAFFSAMAMAAVDLNAASAADLNSLKGIGPSTASKILAARKDAAFKDWQDFTQRVNGIGEARAAKLSEQGLRINGAAYKAIAKPANKSTPPKNNKTTDRAKGSKP